MVGQAAFDLLARMEARHGRLQPGEQAGVGEGHHREGERIGAEGLG